MKAFKMDEYVIAADILEEAREFFKFEVEREPPENIEELEVDFEIPVKDGKKTVRDLINVVMDERSAWLRMGIPCDLHFPFILGKLS